MPERSHRSEWVIGFVALPRVAIRTSLSSFLDSSLAYFAISLREIRAPPGPRYQSNLLLLGRGGKAFRVIVFRVCLDHALALGFGDGRGR